MHFELARHVLFPAFVLDDFARLQQLTELRHDALEQKDGLFIFQLTVQHLQRLAPVTVAQRVHQGKITYPGSLWDDMLHILGFHRAATACDHPAFIGMLADLVREGVGAT